MNTNDTKIALAPQAIAADQANVGEILDLASVEMIDIVSVIGAYAAGSFQLKIEHGDESDLSDAADVDAANQIRGNLYDTEITPSGANRVYRWQLLKFKRYARITSTSANNADYSQAVNAELSDLRASLSNDSNVA